MYRHQIDSDEIMYCMLRKVPYIHSRVLFDRCGHKQLLVYRLHGKKKPRRDLLSALGIGCRYSLQHGAAFGLSHGLDQLAVFRPAVHDSKVGGLYFCGASTRPGNGIPLVLIGSRITTERIMKDAAADGRR